MSASQPAGKGVQFFEESQVEQQRKPSMAAGIGPSWQAGVMQAGSLRAAGEQRLRRLLVVTVASVVVLFSIMAVVFELRIRSDVRDQLSEELSSALNNASFLVEDRLHAVERNVQFLYVTPPISGMPRARANNNIDPKDGTSFDVWRDRLSTIFTGMMQIHPEYDQIRVIDYSDTGMELVRVERQSGVIQLVSDDRLQSKASHEYYSKAVSLEPGEVYFSPINLNREFGKVQYPYNPVVRVAMPIFYRNGDRFGFIIINKRVSELLNQLRSMMPEEFSLVIADADGHYIEHPNPDYRFSADLMVDRNWHGDYQFQRPVGKLYGTATPEQGEAMLYREHLLRLPGGDAEQTLDIVVMAPESLLHDKLMDKRIQTYLFALLTIAVATILLSAVFRSLYASVRLAAARAQQEAIIRGSTDAIVGVDLQRTINSWNESASRLLGFAAFDVMGTSVDDIDDALGNCITSAIDQLKRARKVDPFETTYSDPSGKSVQLTITVSPVKSEQGVLEGIAAIIRDVTDQRKSEARIAEMYNELESEVAERTAELALAHKQAQQASEVKSAFISNISHEMRTPLNGVIGTLQLMDREPLSENQTRFLQMCKKSAGNLAVLINSVLDLSKIEAGKLEFDNKPFQPLQFAESMANSQALRAQQKGLEFVLDLNAIVHRQVVGDASRLNQVLSNLIANAIKFTHEGQIVVVGRSRVSDSEKIILEFEVRDTGIGIAEENRSHIFEAFTQETASTGSTFGGTGLGLSICQQLCQMMGGEIGFESTLGVGSRFWFWVEMDGDPADLMDHATRLDNKRYLVVADNSTLREMLQRTIAQFGGAVVERFEFDDAPSEETPIPDMVFVDSVHQELDFLLDWRDERAAQQQVVPSIVVMHVLDDRLERYGNNCLFLPKPVTISRLLDVVDNRRSEKHSAGGAERRRSDIKKDDYLAIMKSISDGVVLVVDDDQINIEVACGLLDGMSLELLTVNDGQQALDLLQQCEQTGKSVDCILMDCQMPVMNGYVATQRIRQGAAGVSNQDVSIIAMTANAMVGEREKCLAAGMNDFLTKPVSALELRTKLMQWIQKSRSIRRTERARAPAHTLPAVENVVLLPTSGEPLDWDREAALERMMQNTELFNRIVMLFRNRAPEKLDNLRRELEAGSIEGTKLACHSLKGLCGDIGGARLRNLLQEMERTAYRGDLASLRLRLPEVVSAFETLISCLDNYSIQNVGNKKV